MRYVVLGPNIVIQQVSENMVNNKRPKNQLLERWYWSKMQHNSVASA
jgi:hypothetical protein